MTSCAINAHSSEGQIAGWKSKINNSSTTESELWTNAGSTALFQLQETMLKSHKIWCTYLVISCVSLRTFGTPLVFLVLRVTQESSWCHVNINASERHS